MKVLGGNSSGVKLPANVFEAVTLIHRRADHTSDPDIPFSNLMLMAVYESEKGKKGENCHFELCQVSCYIQVAYCEVCIRQPLKFVFYSS